MKRNYFKHFGDLVSYQYVNLCESFINNLLDHVFFLVLLMSIPSPMRILLIEVHLNQLQSDYYAIAMTALFDLDPCNVYPKLDFLLIRRSCSQNRIPMDSRDFKLSENNNLKKTFQCELKLHSLLISLN